MFNFLGGGSKSLVGLDVGSSAVKLVSLKETKTGYALESSGKEILPPDAIVEGVIAKKDVVSGAIGHLFTDWQVKEDKVATSVSGHSVIVKKIALPAASEEEVRESIQWEAEQYIPFDIADVYLDFHLLGPSEDGNQMDVILVAAKRETIDDQTGVISMAEKMPVVVDIDSFALHNVYEMNYAPEEEKVVALLNIGAAIMNVNIASGSDFIFTRDIGMGGNYYTEYVQRDLGVEWAEAEQYKLGNAPEELKPTVSSVVQSVSEILALEVQKTFDYFRTASQFDEIQDIFICGGASRTEGLRAYLQDTFQVPVSFLNPFYGLEADGGVLPKGDESAGTEYAVAVGLALRKLGDNMPAGSQGGFLGKLLGR